MFEVSFRALDVGARIQSDIETADYVLPRFFGSFPALEGAADVEYLLTHGKDGRTRYELFSDGRTIQRVDSAGSMIDWVVSDMSQRALRDAREVAVVHAACVAREGVGIMLVGPPDHGKTTTALGLVRSGWSLLSDEAAVISLADRSARPFPRPLMVSGSSMALFPDLASRLPAEYERFRRATHHLGFVDLQLTAPVEPVPISLIVAPSYRVDTTTVLEPMPRAEALMLQLDQCFNFPALGVSAVTTLAAMTRDTACFRLAIGDLDAAVELLDALVEGMERVA